MAAPQFEESKKVVATVAVFPILFLIYFIAGKDSAYVRYCANQGLIFTILGIIISVVAKVIGFIPIIGFIAGIVLGVEAADLYEDFAFSVAFVYWATALISGTLFLGFAEIIKLLNDIKNK